MAIAKTEEAAEEIIAQAVFAFRKRYPAASIAIVEPEELLLVPMDALLITQVMNNLLDNTQRHSGKKGAVTIEMQEQGGYARISVSDTGPGVPPDRFPFLFEPYPARSGNTHLERPSRFDCVGSKPGRGYCSGPGS